uniref:Hexose transporter 1 n=1 Tax=Pseudo-nitzschia delicatissima TaxID=44447 RepID=A0A7S0TCP6_9STRA|mmetsp:Transcript_1200/g.2722  ORF Transcript_1200/g.2722 Transcript_1200/m.2722 type:complete len:505 (+) Transcript_1200:137-1651(+)
MTADSEGANTKVTRSTVVFALCAALNSCNLGYDIGVSTNAGPLVQSEFGLSDVQRELFLGSLNFWSIFGSVFSHWICDVLGRRRAFQVAAIHFIIGVLILSVANGFATLMAGRFFLGIGVGFGLAIDPLYISEMTPAAHRGRLVTWSEMAINVGIVLGFCSGLVFYNVDENLEWRLMFGMGAILPMILIVVSEFVMAESPRWLVSKGRHEEAKVILQKIYPEGFDVDSVEKQIVQSLERDRLAEGVGWSMIRSPTPAIKRMLVVGIGVAVAQQAVGIDAIQYYLLDVLKDVLQEDEDGREDKASKQVIYILCVLGLLKLFFVVIGSLLLDNRGRKKLLNVSLLGMCGACILISMSFIGETSSTFVILGLALYLISFSIGMGPVAWLIPSEIFPTSMRAKGMSIATFCNRIVATLMASTFLSTSNAIGWGAFFLLLAVVCVVVFVFVFFLLPETKGKSLEDMSLYFAEITGDNEILEAERRVLAGEGGLEMTTTPGEKLSAGELT